MAWIEEQGRRCQRAALKGSMTVELAALMPVIFLAIFGVLSVSFLVHDRVWLTCAAYEAASVGILEGLEDQEEGRAAAKSRALMLKDELYWGGEGAACQVREEGKKLEVAFYGRRSALYGGMDWDYQVSGSRKQLRPTAFLRKLRLGKELWE